MDILVLLASRAGQVVSRDQILDQIWKSRHVAESVLPRCIAELREALGDDPGRPSYVETIPKRGYRLIAPAADSAGVPSDAKRPSVLVLPFRDLSEKGDQQYFCDGPAEQIINSLTRVRGLRVIGRNSAFLLRGDVRDLTRIKTRIDVDKILEGGVRKAGEQIRVTVELLDVAGECYVWSRSYEGTTGDIFNLQDEIALTVVEKLKLDLLDTERTRVAKRHTNDVEAHTWYWKGLLYWNQRTGEGIRLSRECFETAIRQDPGYALPYVALANSHSAAGLYSMVHPAECFSEARRLVHKALALAPNLAEAHAALGWTTFLSDWDWPAAEASFRLALGLSPNYSTTCVWYALALSWVGRPDEAAGILERACVSGPLSPLLAVTRGVLLYQQERFQAARDQFRGVLQVESNFSLAHFHLGRVLVAAGDFERAAEHARNAIALGFPPAAIVLAFAHAKAGRGSAAKAVLDETLARSRTEYVSPAAIAYMYLALGEPANARHWLADAGRLRDPLLLQIRSDPLVKDLLPSDSERCV
jgi:TolB-like protein/tetratricopeptide (TPR) repeat protein